MLTDEMVITLDTQAIEVKVRRHAAKAIIRLIDIDMMARRVNSYAHANPIGPAPITA